MNDIDVLTFSVGCDDEQAKDVLAALAEARKLPRFVDAIVERRDTWTTLCWLEEDLLAFARKNRWGGAVDDWALVVGRCPFLEDVPSYTGYGKRTWPMQAWLEYAGQWVVAIQRPELRQREDQADVGVRDAEDFYADHSVTRIAGVAFADDSGIHLNRALRAVRDLESNYAMTPAQFEIYLEEQTQRYLDMSASEFRERAEAGTLPDTPMAAHLLVLMGGP